MQDQALTSSLNDQNLIVSNAANVPMFHPFSWWIGRRDCALNIFIDILLQNLLCQLILPYKDDMENLTQRCD